MIGRTLLPILLALLFDGLADFGKAVLLGQRHDVVVWLVLSSPALIPALVLFYAFSMLRLAGIRRRTIFILFVPTLTALAPALSINAAGNISLTLRQGGIELFRDGAITWAGVFFRSAEAAVHALGIVLASIVSRRILPEIRRPAEP
ncbi:hypothetical protein DKG75_03290 [Zavarzinia compransoris]|uniref:Uncharacterized protein n=1 Tax=Zavarzinia compransoris TaxID=1264899 RepID=A0A317EBG5_9PROT|nr:hypothetical protein DKG75_03290 [Zavarzinia compransoris]